MPFFLRVTNRHSQRCRKKTRSREKQFGLSSVLTCSEVFSNLNESMILSLGSRILLLNCKDALAPLWQHDTFLTPASYAPYLWGCRQCEGIYLTAHPLLLYFPAASQSVSYPITRNAFTMVKSRRPHITWLVNMQ